MKATLTIGQARGMVLAAGKKDPRFYLNGVHIDFDNRRAYATDGKAIIAFNIDAAGKGSATIPREALENICKGGKITDKLVISVGKTTAKLDRENGQKHITAIIDAKYPDVTRVIPKDSSNVTAQFDPDLLARTQKALRLVLDRPNASPFLSHNGDSAALYTVRGYSYVAIAAVMPWKPDAPTAAAAEWLDYDRRGDDS